MCLLGDYDFGFNIRQENHRWVDAGVESVGLIFALMSLLLIVVPLWLKCLCVAPHQRVCHVGTHFSFGAKRLCAPRLVDRVHNSERIDQLNIFEEGTDVFDVSAVFVFPLELKPRFIKHLLKVIFFCRGLCCQSRLREGAYF